MKNKNIIRKCRSFLCLVLAVSMLTAGCGLFGDDSNESSVESGESGESLYVRERRMRLALPAAMGGLLLILLL